jgi:hypothetical protein
MTKKKAETKATRGLCDYERCGNVAYREIYVNERRGKFGWYYLCRKHFEKERNAGKLEGWCSID